MIKETTYLKKSKEGYMGGSGGRKKVKWYNIIISKKLKKYFLNVTQHDQQPGTSPHEHLPQRYCGIFLCWVETNWNHGETTTWTEQKDWIGSEVVFPQRSPCFAGSFGHSHSMVWMEHMVSGEGESYVGSQVPDDSDSWFVPGWSHPSLLSLH